VFPSFWIFLSYWNQIYWDPKLIQFELCFKFPSFWVVLHIGIETRGYGIDTQEQTNLKLGFTTEIETRTKFQFLKIN
jgi:hypothetical protein